MSQGSNRKTAGRKGFGTNRSLDLYLHEINKTALLKREEEQELARRIRKNDKDALDQLVKALWWFGWKMEARRARRISAGET